MKQMGQIGDIRGLWVKMMWVFLAVFLSLFSKLKTISKLKLLTSSYSEATL